MPRESRDAQRSPERPRETQRGPERPREPQRGPERPREAQRAPENPREPQRCPERPETVVKYVVFEQSKRTRIRNARKTRSFRASEAFWSVRSVLEAQRLVKHVVFSSVSLVRAIRSIGRSIEKLVKYSVFAYVRKLEARSRSVDRSKRS